MLLQTGCTAKREVEHPHSFVILAYTEHLEKKNTLNSTYPFGADRMTRLRSRTPVVDVVEPPLCRCTLYGPLLGYGVIDALLLPLPPAPVLLLLLLPTVEAMALLLLGVGDSANAVSLLA